ncbi:MAG: bacillithiol system redox-active protein YtxJ [Bacillus sp. (in: firmicutes)]
MKHITSVGELDQVIQKEESILFKHSATCPVSAAAFDEYKQWAGNNPDFPAVYLVVQEDRDLSQTVAETYHVKHESPQAILFRKGNVAWHASHWHITKDSIEKAVTE